MIDKSSWQGYVNEPHQSCMLERKRQSFTFSYIAPLPPIQGWKVTPQFPTKTIQFCTTFNEGGGEKSIKDVKSANHSNGFVYHCSFTDVTLFLSV